ncbi:MAG: hypothetical protein QOE59_421 [Actinomycetota bacterium]|jgi:hypothetical protein|nr:hypothetical protein [Actinomycetota bacterium]
MSSVESVRVKRTKALFLIGTAGVLVVQIGALVGLDGIGEAFLVWLPWPLTLIAPVWLAARCGPPPRRSGDVGVAVAAYLTGVPMAVWFGNFLAEPGDAWLVVVVLAYFVAGLAVTWRWLGRRTG